MARARSIGQLVRPVRPATSFRPAISTAIAVWLTNGLMCFRSKIDTPRTLNVHDRRTNGSAPQISIVEHDIDLDGRLSPEENLTSCQVHIISPASVIQSHDIRNDALDHPLGRPSGLSALGSSAPCSMAPCTRSITRRRGVEADKMTGVRLMKQDSFSHLISPTLFGRRRVFVAVAAAFVHRPLKT